MTNEQINHNHEERCRLFRDAKQISVSDTMLEKAIDKLSKRFRRGKTEIPISASGEKEVFICWLSRYNGMYDVTVMGYAYATYVTFEEAVKAVLQLSLAHKKNDYVFHYGI